MFVTSQFSWKIKLGEEDALSFHVKGSLQLQRITKEQQSTMQQVLDWLVDKCTTMKVSCALSFLSCLQKDIQDLQRANQELQDQRDQAIQRFTQLTHDKKNLEEALFHKVLLDIWLLISSVCPCT